MKKFIVSMVLTVSMVLGSTMVLANPNMLPAHPGYPMSAAKSPVTGQPVANDPGEAPPSVEESLKGASAFYDGPTVNAQKEVRPNIVYEKKEEKKKK